MEITDAITDAFELHYTTEVDAGTSQREALRLALEAVMSAPAAESKPPVYFIGHTFTTERGGIGSGCAHEYAPMLGGKPSVFTPSHVAAYATGVIKAGIPNDTITSVTITSIHRYED